MRGKLSVVLKRVKQSQDHPRACGENCKSDPSKIDRLGSPPRMRGKPDAVQMHTDVGGITPAHAGKTLYIVCILSSGRQHLVQWDKTAFSFAQS